MNKQLPHFELQLNEDDIESTGLVAISLVNSPAIEVPFLMFNKEKIEFSVSPERKIIIGPVIIPNQFIYRNTPFPCQVKFSPDQIEEIVQRFHKTNNSHNVTLEHALSIDGADLLDLFVSDNELGKAAPKGFENLPDKTLFASYKVNDNLLWNSIKAGIFTGFSLEGFFNMFPIKMQKELNEFELFLKVKSEIDGLEFCL